MLNTCQVLSHDAQSHNYGGIQLQVQFPQNKTLPYLVVKDQYFSEEMHNHLLPHIPLQDKDVSKHTIIIDKMIKKNFHKSSRVTFYNN